MGRVCVDAFVVEGNRLVILFSVQRFVTGLEGTIDGFISLCNLLVASRYLRILTLRLFQLLAVFLARLRRPAIIGRASGSKSLCFSFGQLPSVSRLKFDSIVHVVPGLNVRYSFGLRARSADSDYVSANEGQASENEHALLVRLGVVLVGNVRAVNVNGSSGNWNYFSISLLERDFTVQLSGLSGCDHAAQNQQGGGCE